MSERDDALALYYNAVRANPLLTAQEEVDLSRRWRDHQDKEAGRRLVMSNMRAVIKIAGEFANQHAAFADLLQEGTIGLLKAVDRFDPDRGTRFLSYAAWWIRAYIRDFLLRTRSLVRLGTTQRQRTVYSRLGRAKATIAREGLRGRARMDRLVEIIGVDEETIRSMEGRLGGYDVSLDQPVGDDPDSAKRSAFFASSDATPEQAIGDKEEREKNGVHLRSAILELPEREQEIIQRRHLSHSPETLQQVGERLGISRERVRQLEVRAMKRMRRFLEAEGLRKRVA
jgi:RNA polymerase sigma-32 factor